MHFRIPSDLITVRDNPKATYWNMEDGYQSNVNESELYPYRTFGSGVRDSLTIFLSIILDKSHQLCSPYAPGFRISLHAPDDLPRMQNDFIHIPPDQDVYISIKPNVIATSRGLRQYSWHARGCYFKSERKLGFFQSYSQKKCELECLANYTKSQCGCVRFPMPRESTTNVCTIADMLCYFLAESVFSKALMVDDCQCLPDCTSISYHIEIAQAQSKYFEDEDDLQNRINGTG